MPEMPNEQVIKELTDKVKFWFRLNSFFRWIHWTIGVLGVAASTIAASVLAKGHAPTYSLVAAVCFSIVGFVNPQKQSAKYIRAYRMLEPAIREYTYSALSLKGLFEIHKRAEELLNDSEQVVSSTTTPSGNNDVIIDPK